MKGSSVAYRRMLLFINQHISEYVLRDQPIHAPQTQKIRKDIAKALLSEGWIQEGLAFVDKTKATLTGSVEDFFQLEMQLLNYDKVIK